MKKPDPLKPLTRSQLALLAEAIESHDVWRGEIVGNPDERALKEFDAHTAKMRKVLAQLKTQQRELANLRKQLAPASSCVTLLTKETMK